MKVRVCVPNTGWIHKEVAGSLMVMIADNKGYDIDFDLTTDKPIDNTRNKVIKSFLETDKEYLIFLDSDNAPMNKKNPLDLVELDKDVIVLPTPMWAAKAVKTGAIPIVWNCFDKDAHEEEAWREHTPAPGMQRIDSAGSGALVIKRRVLEAIRPAFRRKWDEDGIATVGSDLLFLQKATDMGFEVWANYDYPCHHFKERDLVELHWLLGVRDISHANRPNINTPEYWDGEWAKRGPRVYPFHDEIVKLCENQSVLDFGCGRGDLLERLGEGAEGCDISKVAIEKCRERGLEAFVADIDSLNGKRYDTIVCTEVLEHVDDDRGMLEKFFQHADRVIYTVPNNCLPPGLEKEHRRVYTEEYVRTITPNLKQVSLYDTYIMAIAEKE